MLVWLRRGLAKAVETERAIHMHFGSRYPRVVPAVDWLLALVVDRFFSSPLFAVILTLVLVVMGVAGVDKIVLGSVWGAWVLSFLWIARSDAMRKLPIVTRVVVLLITGLSLAFTGRIFGNWALAQYRQQQAKQVPAPLPSSQPASQIAEEVVRRLPPRESHGVSDSVTVTVGEAKQKATKPDSLPRPNVLSRLLLDCDHIFVPVDIRESEFYVFYPFPGSGGSLAKLFSAKGSFGSWPQTPIPVNDTRQCTVRMLKGTDSLVNLVIPVTVTFYNAERVPPNSIRLAAPSSVEYTRIDIPLLEASSPFRFFIQNYTAFGVDIHLGETVTVGAVGMPLEITNRSRVLRMFPIRENVK